MENNELKIEGEYIDLTQLMKVANWVSSGSEAHFHISSGQLLVNGEKAEEKRKKLFPGDIVVFGDKQVKLS